ncbi:MAG: DUF547 domain-containing protein [Myxococcota bacterium]
MLWLLLTACGQYLEAGEALNDPLVTGECDQISADVDLPGREELETATTLGYYGLSGLLTAHTQLDDWNGGQMRVVDYNAFINTPDAGTTLADTLSNMSAVDPLALESEAEAYAFWLNLYNVWTLQAAVNQIQIDESWVGASASTWNGEETGVPFVMFTTRFVQVGGLELSLNEVEHGVMRGYLPPEDYADEPEVLETLQSWHDALWKGSAPDALLHVGINCASRSCPDIGATAFTAENVYEMLDQNARDFIKHPGKGAGPDGISTLFNWFRGDFNATFGSVEAFIQTYREGGDAGVNYDVYLEYDWEQNAP